MPKNWTTTTSTTISDYDALSARAFADPQYDAAVTITDETFVVKSTLCHSLDFIPRGNLTNSTRLAIRTAAGGAGTLLTCTTTTGALASGQVRVRHRTGKLEFHADQLAATLYATYTTRVSNVDAALIAQMYNRLRAVESQAGVASETYEAGEDVVAGPGFVDSDGKIYQATPATLTSCGSKWILADTSLGGAATTYRSGDVVPRRSMPANTPIYVGHAGDVTWEADVQETARIQADEYWQYIGKSDDGITLSANMTFEPRRQ